MSPTSFVKMHGAGNDFVVLDGRTTAFPWHDPDAMARLGTRRTGIGCEGFLILLPSDIPDAAFRLVFLNPDGHEADLCGNGTRCAALYGLWHGFVDTPEFRIATGAGLVSARVFDTRRNESPKSPVPSPKSNWETGEPANGKTRTLDERSALVQLRLQPASVPEKRSVSLDDGTTVECVCVDSGVPHAVVFVPDAEAVDVRALGSALRYHAAFAPAGTNVDFVQRTGPDSLRMRTYERGVEDESGACGTGAVAAAVAAVRQFPDMRFPVGIRVSSGDTLAVDPRDPAGPLLTGPACEVFRGEF